MSWYVGYLRTKINFRRDMPTEPFIHDGPLKTQVMQLRQELAQLEAQLDPIERNRNNLENNLGCLFILFQVLSLFTWPQGGIYDELCLRCTVLKNRLKYAEADALKTITPNQTKAFELDRETSRRVVQELRAHHNLTSHSSQQFEDLVANLFKRLGWNVEQTPYSCDGGKDAILRRGTEVVYLECKHFVSGATVGTPHLQKLKGAMIDAGVTRGIIATSSNVSEPAKQYGLRHGIDIMAGDDLQKALLAHKLLHLKTGVTTFVLHCSNCLIRHQFTFSFQEEIKHCVCGNTVSTGLLIVFGRPGLPLPACYE